MIGFGIVFGLILLICGLLFAGLSRPILIPERTAILIALSPKRASQILTNAERSALPDVWQRALRGSSVWPVVLGTEHLDSGWQSFVIVPRWRARSFSDLAPVSVGLASRSSSVGLSDLTRPFSYTDQLAWWIKEPSAELALWMDPRKLFLEENGASNWDLSPMIATLKDGKLRTDVAFQAPKTSTKLTNADLALTLHDGSDGQDQSFAVLSALGLTDLSLADKPLKINGIALGLNASSTIDLRRADFSEPLSVRQAQAILSNFGVTDGQVLTLPDGSVASEIIPSAIGEGSLNVTKRTSSKEWITLTDQSFTLSSTSSTGEPSELSTRQTCGTHTWGHASLAMMRVFLKAIPSDLPSDRIRGFGLGEEGGKLVFCLDR